MATSEEKWHEVIKIWDSKTLDESFSWVEKITSERHNVMLNEMALLRQHECKTLEKVLSQTWFPGYSSEWHGRMVELPTAIEKAGGKEWSFGIGNKFFFSYIEFELTANIQEDILEKQTNISV